MPIDNVEDVETGTEVSNETQVPIDRNAVQRLKEESGASRNTEVSPLVAAAIYEYLGDGGQAGDFEDDFRAQFE